MVPPPPTPTLVADDGTKRAESVAWSGSGSLRSEYDRLCDVLSLIGLRLMWAGSLWWLGRVSLCIEIATSRGRCVASVVSYNQRQVLSTSKLSATCRWRQVPLLGIPVHLPHILAHLLPMFYTACVRHWPTATSAVLLVEIALPCLFVAVVAGTPS